MSTGRETLRCGILLAVILAVGSANARPPDEDVDELVSRINVLPRYNQWRLIEPELRPTLKEVVGMSLEQRERLVRAGTAAQRAVGIFVADQQGDIAALLSYADLLSDREATLPFAQPTAGVEQYARRGQTVGEYLSAAYVEWFGVDVDCSLARFKRFFGDVDEPNHLVHPWIVRLRRAAGDAQQTTRLKKQINALPEEVRWAVLTLGYQDSMYTPDEARKLVAALSPATREALAAGTELLPDEPLFRMNDGAYRRVLREQFRRLVGTPQP
jgi:hypothetical protein